MIKNIKLSPMPKLNPDPVPIIPISTTLRGERLTADKDYQRPKKTQTDMMQNKQELMRFLKDYEEIEEDDIDYIPLGTLLRYISYDKNRKQEMFRYGGLLMKLDRNYMVLKGKNNLTFSVQRYIYDNQGNLLYTTKFFRRLNPQLKVREKEIEELEMAKDFMERQEKIIKKQKDELERLKNMINNNENGERQESIKKKSDVKEIKIKVDEDDISVKKKLKKKKSKMRVV